MTEHTVSLFWERSSDDFAYETYNRTHTWDFGHGVEITASAAPQFFGVEEFVDPEQAFVASIASCHMLTFLALASREKYTVNHYQESAVGFLEKNEKNKIAITKVLLSPLILFHRDVTISDEVHLLLHEKAHQECFIANSVKTEIGIKPKIALIPE